MNGWQQSVSPQSGFTAKTLNIQAQPFTNSLAVTAPRRVARLHYRTPPGKPLLEASYYCGFTGTIELKTLSSRFHDRDNW
jgi:hypothetical protein